MSKIHVCFFLNNEHTFDKWSSVASIFDLCCIDNNFKVSILKENNDISDTYNDFLKNLKNNIKVYTYYDEGKKLDLKKLNIDYVITINPYRQEYMDWNDWKGKFKICLKLYGVYCDKSLDYSDKCKFKKMNIFKKSDFVFCDSLYSQKVLQNYWKNNDKFILSGSTNLDYILKDKSKVNQNIWKLNKTANVKRIIWSPHHSVKPQWLNALNDNIKKGFSQFTKYADLWLKIPKMYPQLDIIMKPHPIMFENLEFETDGEWNKEKITKWKKDFLDNSNTQIIEHGSYDDLFLTSDAIINDSISFIVEYLPTLKPFLLCTSNDCPHYNEFGENIVKAYYKAYSEQDIINFIENVVINNNDPMYEDRIKAMKENIFIPDGGSGKFIKDYIMNDYYNNSHKSINIKEIFRKKYESDNIVCR